MKTYKIAYNNIKRNMVNYGMYFFSLCFCIFASFTFLNLMDNETVAFVYNNDMRYKAILGSFFVILLVSIIAFLINSNTRFVRARKKEISTFALFGMSNMKIGLMLLMEVLIIGYVAMALSIFLGIVFSRFVAMILINITLAEQMHRDIGFAIHLMPIVKTIAIYTGIFVAMALSSWFVISRFQLVDLFKAEKLSEKKTKGSIILLLVSILLIGYGYYMACNKSNQYIFTHTLTILLFVIVGSYIFFYSGLPMVLNHMRKQKRNAYDGVKLITLSTLSHRMKTISISMASIAVLSAVASTAVASTFTLYYNVKDSCYYRQGQDLYYISDERVDKRVTEVFSNSDTSIEDKYEIKSFLAEIDASVEGEYFSLDGKKYVKIYSESELRRLIKLSRYGDFDLKRLNKGESYLLAGGYMFEETKDLIENKEYTIGGKTYRFRDAFNAKGLTFGASEVVVLSDSDFKKLYTEGIITDKDVDDVPYESITAIKYSDPLKSHDLNKELIEVLKESKGYSLVYTDYKDTLMTFGLICFIGMFMGVLFILMTASNLYFEQVMLGNEEKHYYKMLRKIGLDERSEARMVTRRLLPIFFIPLALGILHSVFAMKAADTVMFKQVVISSNTYVEVLKSSGLMYFMYVVVYSIFYLITKKQYKHIIKPELG